MCEGTTAGRQLVATLEQLQGLQVCWNLKRRDQQWKPCGKLQSWAVLPPGETCHLRAWGGAPQCGLRAGSGGGGGEERGVKGAREKTEAHMQRMQRMQL